MNEAYKVTPIGLIPESWRLVPIYELRNKADRYSFTGGPFGSDLKSEDYTDTGVRVIQLQNIGEGVFIDKGFIYTSVKKAEQLKSCNIYPGEIILAKMAPVARCCKVPSFEDKFLMSSDGIRLSVDDRRFDKEFVFQALNSKYFRKKAESLSTGTTRARIGLKELKNIELAVPSTIYEQKKIGEILSTIDEKIDVINRKIAETEKLKQGLMNKLFATGIGHTEFRSSELGDIPKNWEVVALAKYIDLLSGFAFKSDLFNTTGEGTKLLRGINITVGKLRWDEKIDKFWNEPFKEIEKYLLKHGDLVISMDGSLVGRNYAKVGKLSSPLLLVQRVARIRTVKSLNSDFLFHIVGSPLFVNYVDSVKTSSGIPHISSKDIKCFKIPLPPVNEQNQIAEILNSIDQKMAVLKDKNNNYQSLKASLMQQLLTGKIRVNTYQQQSAVA